MLEKTFFMVKPDGLSRGLESEVFKRIEQAGLKTIQKRRFLMSRRQAEDLYSPHLGKSFYDGLVKFITSGEVIGSVVEGKRAVNRVRELMGDTDPRKAAMGTIRGDLKEDSIYNPDGIIKNMVHGSDSPESAKREIAIFFKEE